LSLQGLNQCLAGKRLELPAPMNAGVVFPPAIKVEPASNRAVGSSSGAAEVLMAMMLFTIYVS
jgi:hypothetical protein